MLDRWEDRSLVGLLSVHIGSTASVRLNHHAQCRDPQYRSSGGDEGVGRTPSGEGDGGNRRLAVGDVAQRHDLALSGDGDGARRGVEDVAGRRFGLNELVGAVVQIRQLEGAGVRIGVQAALGAGACAVGDGAGLVG